MYNHFDAREGHTSEKEGKRGCNRSVLPEGGTSRGGFLHQQFTMHSFTCVAYLPTCISVPGKLHYLAAIFLALLPYSPLFTDSLSRRSLNVRQERFLCLKVFFKIFRKALRRFSAKRRWIHVNLYCRQKLNADLKKKHDK